MKTKKKTKAQLSQELVGRRAIGIKVLAGGKTLPQAYLIYKEWYADGSKKVVRGHSVHTVESPRLLNARTKKEAQWAKDE